MSVKHEMFNCQPNSNKSKYGVYSKFNIDTGILRFYLGDSKKTGIQEHQYCSMLSISPTITTSHRIKLWDLGRTLTDLEHWRLMGCSDDDYGKISHMKSSRIMKMIGNSIPVNLLECIFGKMLRGGYMSETLRVIELFSGYGSQAMALRNLGINHEVVAISEFDEIPAKAYEAIHGHCPNLGDITKIKVEDLPDSDLITFSFPCQSYFSSAMM